MTADEQEALSRCYGNDIILILPLTSGRIAVFNNARKLCGIVERVEDAPAAWRAPAKPQRGVDLKELGLI